MGLQKQEENRTKFKPKESNQLMQLPKTVVPNWGAAAP